MPDPRDNDAERLVRIELLLEEYRVRLARARQEATRLHAASRAAARQANGQLTNAPARAESVPRRLSRKSG